MVRGGIMQFFEDKRRKIRIKIIELGISEKIQL